MRDDREYHREWWAKNRERINAARRSDPEYVAKHREEARSWYRENREKVLARAHDRYLRNKEQRRDYNRGYHERNREKLRAASSERYQKNRARYLSNQQLKKYGLTRDQFDALLSEQGNVCAVCREPFTKRPAVDHDHRTGAVRGLLCGSCNGGLGLFRDNPAFLAAAITYLRDAASAGLRAA